MRGIVINLCDYIFSVAVAALLFGSTPCLKAETVGGIQQISPSSAIIGGSNKSTIGKSDAVSMVLAMKQELSEDQEELMALLAVLEEETEIATKTKMNSDYVPGMVSVLHGEHLEAMGVKTAAEAMSLIPGIQVSLNRAGQPVLNVRGTHYPFNSGNVKVLLNAIALSRESSGINSSVLFIPIEQVDRIGVIRGPGSNIHGDFAMGGLVA